MQTKYHYHQDGIVPPNTYIFVFGSNLRGRHGLGGALLAAQSFGAQEGVGVGLLNNAYAIPTKDRFIQTLTLDEIVSHVRDFARFTFARADLKFFVTRVGCGLAGYSNQNIAPMFADCHNNCSFPEPWKPYLG
jgi:hypothetical protein